ncbi:MAG: protein translocase subunit SecF [Candidatus Doudnabacteria bacterium]|nr:protein translocase subunit SecF [Candidatus Doudnabacteria bacterium]
MLKILTYYKYLFAVSAIILVVGVGSLAMYGLRLGIDFNGGTITEVEYSVAPDIEVVAAAVAEAGIESVQLQTTGERGLLIKTPAISNEEHATFLEKLKERTGAFEEKRFESIGPIVGEELRTDALWQLFLVSAGIILYIAYAFRRVQRPITSWKFGWAAIVALLHDLLVVLGVFSLLGHYRGVEVDSMFVTAMLTVLGFSIHDTIVVFDRIRENLKVYAGQSIEYIVNKSITQTIVRSLNTSLTVLFVLLALLLFGGESIRYFVLALFIGIVTGTYSSIFVASPILVLWQRWSNRKA